MVWCFAQASTASQGECGLQLPGSWQSGAAVPRLVPRHQAGPPRSARSAIVTLQQLKELVLRMFCKDKALGIMIAHDIEGRAYTCFKDKCGAAGRARSLDSALDSMTNFVLTVSAITEEANT